MTDKAGLTTHTFEADVHRVLSLVINSLYSHKEIFLRELISNASDALDQLQFNAITEPEMFKDDSELVIRLIPDEESGTLTIYDTGIGMTHEELVEGLGTIAYSGTREFLQRLEDAQKDAASFIGQFGVGFYSAFLVADRVDVISRSATSHKAYQWSSSAGETFTIQPAERERRGTSVILYLKEDQKEYLKEFSLRSLVKQYSDYVNHPIELRVQRPKGDDDDDAEIEITYERINKGTALWQRSKEDITEEQYEEFYKHLTYDWEGPLARTHFKIEGAQMFTGLLFIPKRTPFDLHHPSKKGGIRLYVRRVFIMDDFEELLPQWLRFVRGVIDSDDLPLNISRETLQDSRIVRIIRKQTIKKTLNLLEELASDNNEDYLDFWSKYGSVLKEGVHLDGQYADRISELLRYESSTQDGWTSLGEYAERMSEDQPAIYYVMGYNRSVVENSPHLEVLRQRGYEILYMTDAIDQWVVDRLNEYDGKSLVSAMDADLKLEEKEGDEKTKQDQQADLFKPLMEHMTSLLEEHVREVRPSERLTDSPICLVIPPGGLHAHIERLLRLNNERTSISKRILEINPNHPIIHNLKRLYDQNPDSPEIAEWVEVLFDQALITEGSPIHDPARFGLRMTRLMETAIATRVEGSEES